MTMLSPSRLPDAARIAAAVDVIDPVFLGSPAIRNPALDARLGCSLIAKVETLNPIRSFKGRGTDLVLSAMAEAAGQRGGAGLTVVTASAGNFGQGLAHAGGRRTIEVIVYASMVANPLKVDAMRRLGARVIQEGADFDEAKRAGRAFAAEHGLPFIEDGAVAEIAEGAGTIALELTRTAPVLDAVLVPLGNGALATGMGTWLRAERPGCRVIGVVAERTPSMMLSWQARSARETETADTIADGIAIRVPVPYALDCMPGTVDEVVSVSEAAIVGGMRLAHETLGLVVEPAGAAGLAAAVAHRERFRGMTVATVLCGGNVTPDQVQQWLCTAPAPASPRP